MDQNNSMFHLFATIPQIEPAIGKVIGVGFYLQARANCLFCFLLRLFIAAVLPCNTRGPHQVLHFWHGHHV